MLDQDFFQALRERMYARWSFNQDQKHLPRRKPRLKPRPRAIKVHSGLPKDSKKGNGDNNLDPSGHPGELTSCDHTKFSDDNKISKSPRNSIKPPTSWFDRFELKVDQSIAPGYYDESVSVQLCNAMSNSLLPIGKEGRLYHRYDGSDEIDFREVSLNKRLDGDYEVILKYLTYPPHSPEITPLEGQRPTILPLGFESGILTTELYRKVVAGVYRHLPLSRSVKRDKLASDLKSKHAIKIKLSRAALISSPKPLYLRISTSEVREYTERGMKPVLQVKVMLSGAEPWTLRYERTWGQRWKMAQSITVDTDELFQLLLERKCSTSGNKAELRNQINSWLAAHLGTSGDNGELRSQTGWSLTAYRGTFDDSKPRDDVKVSEPRRFVLFSTDECKAIIERIWTKPVGGETQTRNQTRNQPRNQPMPCKDEDQNRWGASSLQMGELYKKKVGNVKSSLRLEPDYIFLHTTTTTTTTTITKPTMAVTRLQARRAAPPPSPSPSRSKAKIFRAVVTAYLKMKRRRVAFAPLPEKIDQPITREKARKRVERKREKKKKTAEKEGKGKEK
ncbi:hypothetical protein EG329_001603 [Mollisiaceae sp. DMI_Dod_QoI]|nr:hypothetical protein EG329_001603 [Helotiales sp. DMI_Dod_QoI]